MGRFNWRGSWRRSSSPSNCARVSFKWLYLERGGGGIMGEMEGGEEGREGERGGGEGEREGGTEGEKSGRCFNIN